MARHKVPIHLETPDRLLLNMTAQQTLVIALGGTLAYIMVQSAWSNPLLLALAVVLAVLFMIVALLVAFVTPKKRSMDVWAMVILNYYMIPKCYAWRALPETTRTHRSCQAEEPEPDDNEDE
jgi:hypothetical protein